MSATEGGPTNGGSGGSPGWAGDDTPLLFLSPEDRLTIRQSFEGIFVMGQTGSGKASGPGQAAAVALMRSGDGGVFHTTRPDDARTYMQWARLAGRAKDVRVFSPQEPWRLSLLDYAYRRTFTTPFCAAKARLVNPAGTHAIACHGNPQGGGRAFCRRGYRGINQRAVRKRRGRRTSSHILGRS